MGTILLLLVDKSTIAIAILVIIFITIMSIMFIKGPKWKKEDEEREKNKPDLCKEGDFIIGKIVTIFWYSDMRGWVIRRYGNEIKGYVDTYRRDVNCVRINGEWYIITDDKGGLHIDAIIPKINKTVPKTN